MQVSGVSLLVQTTLVMWGRGRQTSERGLFVALWGILSVRGGEETSYPPHADGKQGKLIWQEKDALFQVPEEAHLLRPHLHPERYLWLLQELLQDPEQVARVLILVHRKLVKPWALLLLQSNTKNTKRVWAVWYSSDWSTLSGNLCIRMDSARGRSFMQQWRGFSTTKRPTVKKWSLGVHFTAPTKSPGEVRSYLEVGPAWRFVKGALRLIVRLSAWPPHTPGFLILLQMLETFWPP